MVLHHINNSIMGAYPTVDYLTIERPPFPDEDDRHTIIPLMFLRIDETVEQDGLRMKTATVTKSGYDSGGYFSHVQETLVCTRTFAAPVAYGSCSATKAHPPWKFVSLS